MNTKKFLVPSIFLALTIVAYIAATVIFCYKTKPEIKTGEFPFSITYEYKGETKTFTGVYKCEYSGSRTIWNEHKRYWEGETIVDNPLDPENHSIIDRHDYMTLALHENMSAGYFMGDPLYKDYYRAYDLDGVEPCVDYYDYTKGIEESYATPETLETIGFKIIDCTYPEPIENKFHFSGISYAADNVVIFIAILLVFLLLCVIFVRKDKAYKYSYLDKLGIILNFIVAIIALPFISIVCVFSGINGGGTDILSQITYNIPSISILCLALSVVFRRKGISKTGFFIQFGGCALFALLILIETIF